jgi:hypothetical protein
MLSALAFGAAHVDAVEINPIIATDVMRGALHDYSGRIYSPPGSRIARGRRPQFRAAHHERYDIIQASLVDTWAATAAGALHAERELALHGRGVHEYLDSLTDEGILTITRWVFDGLRLVSLAQEVCERRGLDATQHLAIVQHDRVATFLLKKTPFSSRDVRRLREATDRLGFTLLYAPGAVDPPPPPDAGARWRHTVEPLDYPRLILASDRAAFIDNYALDIRPTSDDRPFFFHTTRLENQFQVAFGRSMLFGNGLSALLTLFGISAGLVLLFVIGPLLLDGTRPSSGRAGWLLYFGALGAGFMLIEVALLQHFVLLLGHPVYSLTVTLFSILLGTGIGSLAGRRVPDDRLAWFTLRAIGAVIAAALLAALFLPRLIDLAIPWPLPMRILVAGGVLVPLGVLLGTALPGGMRLMARRHPDVVAWGWGMNGAFSVIGATLAVFIAMNWGFMVALVTGAAVYAAASLTLYAECRMLNAEC